jgi:hypothetical protein
VRAGGLDDVQPLLAGIEPQLVGEVEPLGHHAQAVLVQPRDVAVAHASRRGLCPGVDTGVHGDPQTLFRVAQHEVDLADGLAVDAVVQRARGAVA